MYITSEDAEKLKAQSLRTKFLFEQWSHLFDPFGAGSKHLALNNFRNTCISLFSNDEAPGRLLLTRILPHQWLEPLSLSVSKELIVVRQKSNTPLSPWGKKEKDRNVIYFGPYKTLRIEQKMERLPCETEEESQKAQAWLAVALSSASQDPLKCPLFGAQNLNWKRIREMHTAPYYSFCTYH